MDAIIALALLGQYVKSWSRTLTDRSEADCVSNDLVERVARALVSPKADPSDWRFWTDEARAAIAAALNAWPNVTTTSWFENGVRKAVLNIPLPQEVSDE